MLWAQGALHVFCSISVYVCYWPKKRTTNIQRPLKEILWACDPIGCFFYTAGATLLLMGLAWSSGSYPWESLHVALPFALGLLFLILFALYGRRSRFETFEYY